MTTTSQSVNSSKSPSIYTGCVSRVSLSGFSMLGGNEDFQRGCYPATADSSVFDIKHDVVTTFSADDMVMSDEFIDEMFTSCSDEDLAAEEDYFLQCNQAL